MPRDESLEQMVERRNKRLLRFFTSLGYDVRLVGDAQKPAVILNEVIVLSCFAKNFDLNFTREPFGDEIVKSFKLKADNETTKLELQEAIEQCTHRPVYKVSLTGTELYLVGYNYLNSEESMGRYPVFAKHRPKVYFDREYIGKLVESLRNEGYDIIIV